MRALTCATAVASAAAFAVGDSLCGALMATGANPLADADGAASAIIQQLSNGNFLYTSPMPLCVGLACACLVWVAWARAAQRKGEAREGEEHGSARWATAKDVRPLSDRRDPDNNILLTQSSKIKLVDRDHDQRCETNDNVLIVGGPGTGKTRYYVKPNLLQLNADFFITDPKGTLIHDMGWVLEGAGYEIRTFDTIDFSRSMRFNPLAYVEDEAGILRFAHCLISNTDGDPDHKGDPYWEKAEQLMYTALAGYLVFHCEPEDRNINGLLTLLSLADARDGDEDYLSPLDMLFRELETGERYVPRDAPSQKGGGLRGFSAEDASWEWRRVCDPVPAGDFALSSYREFRVAAGDTMKSILSSCNVRMKPFAIREVRDLTSADEMDFAHMGDAERKVAVFASMSDTDSTFDFLFALFMDTAMNALCSSALGLHGGSLPRPVHFVFDEFANIGRIPDFERTITVTRSRNIAVSMVLQSLSQLKAAYGEDNAETIVNACDTLLYLGGKSNETNRQICDMAGKQTVANVTASDSRGSGWSRTVSYGLVERDLIQPAEVARMPRDHALVLLNGRMPLMDRKYDLSKHPRARLLKDAERRGRFSFDGYRERRGGGRMA